MRAIEEIVGLLDELENCIADDLEADDLDFKEWNERSFDDNVKKIIQMAVCMANGGGGHVVYGVADKVQKRQNAIRGVPTDLDLYALQKRVYERTDPHLSAIFKTISVTEGTGNLLVVSVTGEMAPHTTTDGHATVRKGKDCIPLTGSLRKEMIESGTIMDLTANIISADWASLISASAMEKVREKMKEENAPEDLLALKDFDLLNSIGALRNGYLTIGGLLIFGKAEAIQKYIPEYRWAYRKMANDTEYVVRDEGYQPIPIALYELERYLATDNPIMTVESGLFHHEISTYPKIAIRETLLNAFVHRDYRIYGAVMLKQYKDKLILTNPGRFIGGINANNILHHPSSPRNHHLMELLDRLRLVNRSNIGVPRIYRSLLIEGKEPPSYREVGNSIELTIISSSLFPAFKNFIADLTEKGISLDVDDLLILQYLIRHEEIDSTVAAQVSQRDISQARELLSRLTNELQLLKAVGRGKGRYYVLSLKTLNSLQEGLKYNRQFDLDDESVKMRILTLLKERDLTNQDIRQMTGWGRKKVWNIIKELESSGVRVIGSGRGTKYTLDNNF